MPNQKISLMPAAGPLSGAELVELVQGGSNVKGTTGALASLATTPQYVALAPAAGTYNDVVLPGALDYIYDINTTAGNVIYTGFVAQRDGQRLTFSRTGANALSFTALAGSGAANQIRTSGSLGVAQNDSITFQYSAGAGKWLVI